MEDWGRSLEGGEQIATSGGGGQGPDETRALDETNHQAYGPEQTSRRGRTLWSLRLPGCSRSNTEFVLWHRGSRGIGQSRMVLWSEQFWKLSQARLSFLIRATYNTLPCPRNLQQWFWTEHTCDICRDHQCHILSGCKIALTQGWLRGWHNQVHRKLARWWLDLMMVLHKKLGDHQSSQRLCMSTPNCRVIHLTLVQTSLWTTNVNLMVALQDKSREHQNQ